MADKFYLDSNGVKRLKVMSDAVNQMTGNVKPGAATNRKGRGFTYAKLVEQDDTNDSFWSASEVTFDQLTGAVTALDNPRLWVNLNGAAWTNEITLRIIGTGAVDQIVRVEPYSNTENLQQWVGGSGGGGTTKVRLIITATTVLNANSGAVIADIVDYTNGVITEDVKIFQNVAPTVRLTEDQIVYADPHPTLTGEYIIDPYIETI